MTLALINGRVLTPKGLIEGLAVVIADGRIAKVSPAKMLPKRTAVRDLDGGILAPGFIDVQVNGGGGVLFNDDPSVEAIEAIGRAHRRFGTTGFLPTLISDEFDVIARAIEATRRAIERGVPGVLGVHFEGPFLSAERKGALVPASGLRRVRPDVREVELGEFGGIVGRRQRHRRLGSPHLRRPFVEETGRRHTAFAQFLIALLHEAERTLAIRRADRRRRLRHGTRAGAGGSGRSLGGRLRGSAGKGGRRRPGRAAIPQPRQMLLDDAGIRAALLELPEATIDRADQLVGLGVVARNDGMHAARGQRARLHREGLRQPKPGEKKEAGKEAPKAEKKEAEKKK